MHLAECHQNLRSCLLKPGHTWQGTLHMGARPKGTRSLTRAACGIWVTEQAGLKPWGPRMPGHTRRSAPR